MFQGTFHTKDGFHTALIVGFFCCFFLIAGLYTEKSAAKDDVEQVHTIENSALALSSSELIYNSEASSTKESHAPDNESVRLTQNDIPVPKKEIEVIPSAVEIPPTTEQITLDTEKIKVILPTPLKLNSTNDAEYQNEVIRIITEETNAFRKKQDLLPLRYDFKLEKNAEAYSKMQQDGKFLSHTSLDGCDLTCRFSKDGYNAVSWGENLATMSFTKKQSAKEVALFFMSEWKKSAGHRDNLMSPLFTHQGIGISVSPNSVYATVQFAKPE